VRQAPEAARHAADDLTGFSRSKTAGGDVKGLILPIRRESDFGATTNCR
jgi:hypothetical protein